MTQDTVREKLLKRCEREKVGYIARKIGVPPNLISDFKAGRKNLWPETLEALNSHLDNHYIE